MTASSILCVDASLVVGVVTGTGPATLVDLWHRWGTENRSLVAPLLLRYEVTNAVHRLQVAGMIDTATANTALDSALRLPVSLYSDEDLHRAALRLAARFNRPASYDAHYLALAERLGVEFWTADRRLANAVRPALPWVRLVGE